MRIRVAAAVAIAFASAAMPGRAQHVSFFPRRPPRAALHVFVGTIERFGYGTGRGELAIRDARGRTLSFALAYPYAIDGRTISCHRAPEPADPSTSRALCSDWPGSLVLGRSRVRVTAWVVVRDGVREYASDALRSG